MVVTLLYSGKQNKIVQIQVSRQAGMQPPPLNTRTLQTESPMARLVETLRV